MLSICLTLSYQGAYWYTAIGCLRLFFLDLLRYVLKKSATEEQVVLHLTPEQEKDKSHFVDKETGTELEMAESCPLLEWLANNYKNFGATLEIITDRSQEGSQYVKGFGGIGGNSK